MKITKYVLVETGGTNLGGREFDSLDEAVSMMNYVYRMLTDKEKRAGNSAYVGKAEYETNGSDDRADWDDLNDGYAETWEPGAAVPTEYKEVLNQRQIGRNIAEAREAAKLTQTVLASRIGTSQSQIGKYERGEQDMTMARFIEIAEALGVSPDTLFKGIVK